ncbi:MAG: hypothetical protein WBW33_34730 [Bryobacteraceae bacterium]
MTCQDLSGKRYDGFIYRRSDETGSFIPSTDDAGYGQSPQDADRTFGLSNGHFWLKLSQGQRKIYAFGILDQFLASENAELVAVTKIFDGAEKPTDGPTFAKLSVIGMEATKASMPDVGVLTDVTGSLDRFYSEPQNRIIPIPEALHFLVKKAQGEDPARLAKEIADRAAHWHKPGSGFNY